MNPETELAEVSPQDRKAQGLAPVRVGVGRRGVVLTTLDECLRAAAWFAKAGTWREKFANEAEVFVALQAGMELGVPPFAALNKIAMIKGRPFPETVLLLAACEQSGLLERWASEYFGLGADGGVTRDTGCRVTVWRRGHDEPLTAEYDMGRAHRANLVKDGSQWHVDPRLMLETRALARALRRKFPDVCMGMYTIEEAEEVDRTTANGESSRLDRLGQKLANGSGAGPSAAEPQEAVVDVEATVAPEPESEPEPEPTPQAKPRAAKPKFDAVFTRVAQIVCDSCGASEDVGLTENAPAPALECTCGSPKPMRVVKIQPAAETDRGGPLFSPAKPAAKRRRSPKASTSTSTSPAPALAPKAEVPGIVFGLCPNCKIASGYSQEQGWFLCPECGKVEGDPLRPSKTHHVTATKHEKAAHEGTTPAGPPPPNNFERAVDMIAGKRNCDMAEAEKVLRRFCSLLGRSVTELEQPDKFAEFEKIAEGVPWHTLPT